MSKLGFAFRGASVPQRVGEMLAKVRPDTLVVETDEFGKRMATLLAVKQHADDGAIVVYAPHAINYNGMRYSLEIFSKFVEDLGGNENAAKAYASVINSYKNQLPPDTYIRLFPTLDFTANGVTVDMEASFAEFVGYLLPLIGNTNIVIGTFDIEQVLVWGWLKDTIAKEGFNGRIILGFAIQITHAMLLDFATAATMINVVNETLYRRNKISNVPMLLEIHFSSAGGKGLRTFVNGIEGDEENAVKWVFDLFNAAFINRPYIHSIVMGYIGALDADTLAEDFSRHPKLLAAIAKAYEDSSVADDSVSVGGSIITTYLSPKRYKIDEECYVYKYPVMSSSAVTGRRLGKGELVDIIAIHVNRGIQWGVIEGHGDTAYIPLVNMMTGTQYAYPSQSTAPNIFQTPSNFTPFVAKRDVYLYEDYRDPKPSKLYYIEKGAYVQLSDQIVAGRRVFRVYYDEKNGGKRLYVPIVEWDLKGKRTMFMERVSEAGEADAAMDFMSTLEVLVQRLDELQKRVDALAELVDEAIVNKL